jgi:hypothetical protein
MFEFVDGRRTGVGVDAEFGKGKGFEDDVNEDIKKVVKEVESIPH